MVPSAIPARMSSRRAARNASSRSRKIGASSGAVAASARSSRKGPVQDARFRQGADVAAGQPQEAVQAGRQAGESRHEPGLGGPGEALEQCLLGAEVVRDDAAAVTGPFPDPGQRQRPDAVLYGQLGGGVEQGGLGLVPALLLGTACGGHGRSISK